MTCGCLAGIPKAAFSTRRCSAPGRESYLSLRIQRDLPAWGLPAKARSTERLIRMLAALHGQTLSASQLGGVLALAGKTVADYCDYLEGAFLIRRLQPYFANIRKHLVKSAKVFWRDSGLVNFLLGVNGMDQLFAQPWVGYSWEGFVIEPTLADLAAHGQRATPFFSAPPTASSWTWCSMGGRNAGPLRSSLRPSHPPI